MNATTVTITINGDTHRAVANEDVTIVFGDFLGQILDRFATEYPAAGARAIARLIEQLRILDTDVTLDLDGVRSTGRRMATLDEVRNLIVERVLDRSYIAGAMASAAATRR